MSSHNAPLTKKLSRLGEGMASDAVHMWIPAFFVSVLCFVQDYVITNVLGIPRSFTRYLLWNGIYTFGWVYLTKKRCKSFGEAFYAFLGNAVMYSIVHGIKPYMAHFTTLWLFVPVIIVCMMIVEYLHFRFFTEPRNQVLRAEAAAKGEKYDEDNEEKYVIRTINDKKNHIQSLFITTVFIAGSYLLDCSIDGFAGWQLFLVAVPNGIVGDIFFGVPHNLGHRVPWLWKKHKIHHEYHGNDMTLHANNYLEWLDGILSSQPVIAVLIQDYFLGLSAWHLMDGTIVGLFSHHKYPGHYIAYYHAYELDILLDVLIDHKISMFHHLHHVDMSKRFGISGYLSDKTIAAIGDFFYSRVRSTEVERDHKIGVHAKQE